MLQFLRNKATSLVVKILFVLLVMSFAVWGIGDIFRGGSYKNFVASVEQKEISVSELDQEFRARLSRLSDAGITFEQALDAGLLEAVLQGLVDQRLIEQLAEESGVRMDDKKVAATIAEQMQDENGHFNHESFKERLRLLGLSERTFLNSIKRNMKRDLIRNALEPLAYVPDILLSTLSKIQAETRTATIASFTPDKTLKAPDDSVLETHRKAYVQRFTDPEQRRFTVLFLDQDIFLSRINISEDTLREAFEDRRESFYQPEERAVVQVMVPDQDTKIQTITGKEDGYTNLGWMTDDVLPEDLSRVVFDLKINDISAPVQSEFGWHVFRLDGIKAAQQQDFETIRGALETTLKEEKLGDRLFKQAGSIEDQLAGGTTLAEIATGLELTVEQTDPLSRTDREYPAVILEMGFDLQVGENSQLLETDDDRLVFLEVATIIPAKARPLKDVRDNVLAHWKREQQQKNRTQRAETLLQKLRDGENFKALKTENLDFVVTKPMKRTESGELSAAQVRSLFDLKKIGDSVISNGTVIQLASISQDTDLKTDLLKIDLERGLKNDIFSQLKQNLRAKYKVVVNRALLAQMYNTTP